MIVLLLLLFLQFLKELKRLNTIDVEQLTIENAISTKIEGIIKWVLLYQVNI